MSTQTLEERDQGLGPYVVRRLDELRRKIMVLAFLSSLVLTAPALIALYFRGGTLTYRSVMLLMWGCGVAMLVSGLSKWYYAAELERLNTVINRGRQFDGR
jgi:hypothetical protein